MPRLLILICGALEPLLEVVVLQYVLYLCFQKHNIQLPMGDLQLQTLVHKVLYTNLLMSQCYIFDGKQKIKR